MLDVEPFVGLRERDVLAQVPERARLREVLRDHRIDHEPRVERFFHQLFEQRARMRFTFVVGQFEQHRLRVRLCERIAQLRIVLADELHAEIGHQLEARQQRAGRALRERQEVERRVRRFERGQRRDLRGRQRMQLHHGGRDDAERAFRADEQIAQVVAGVVLAQSAQAVPDLALRRHDLEARQSSRALP